MTGEIEREDLAADRAAGVLMLPIGTGGVLAEVTGRERALQVPGVVGLELLADAPFFAGLRPPTIELIAGCGSNVQFEVSVSTKMILAPE